MSNQQEPKKPRRQKSKRLNISSKERWEHLLKEVHKEQVPVGVLKNLTVNLKDGTVVEINVEQLLKEGIDQEDLERLINKKLNDLDMYISILLISLSRIRNLLTILITVLTNPRPTMMTLMDLT